MLCNFVKSQPIFKNFVLLESVRNLLQNPYDITGLTLGMLLHWLRFDKVTDSLEVVTFLRHNVL